MNNNYIEAVKNIIKEAKTLKLPEIEYDILNVITHNYDISLNHVASSMARIKIFLFRAGRKDLSQELNELMISSGMQNDLHNNFVHISRQLQELSSKRSDTLDYFLSVYGNAREIKQPKNIQETMHTLMNRSKLKALQEEKEIKRKSNTEQLYGIFFVEDLKRDQLEVLLMSNILFTSNRAYIGKIDEYLSRIDLNIENELQTILENSYENRVIQYLDERHEVADGIFSTHADLERHLELVPEDYILDEISEMSYSEFEAWRLQQELIKEMLENPSSPVTSEEAKELEDSILAVISKPHITSINYGANVGIEKEEFGITKINPVIFARYIRNALAHHKWRFCEDGYVHMWNIKKEEDNPIPIMDFNIKIPVEILLDMIKKFIEKIFKDVKYLTINDLTGNYPIKYQEVTLEELVDMLVSDTVILPSDKDLVYKLTKEAVDKGTSFYTNEFCMNRAKVVLEYILNNKELSSRDKIVIEDYINNYLDEFIDKDLDDILEILEDEEIDIDYDKTRDEIEKNITDIDLHFLSEDINMYALDFISTKFIEPLNNDYLLIVDQIKYFDEFARQDLNQPNTDLTEILPSGLRTRELDNKVKVSTLVRTLLTLLFVHTEIDTKLLEKIDFSKLELTEAGVNLSKEALKLKIEDLEKGAKNQIDLYTKNIEEAKELAKVIQEQIEERIRENKKVKAKKKLILEEKLEQIEKNRGLIKLEEEKLERSTRFLKENENNPMLIYSPVHIFNRIRNSLAHGNIIIPDDIDLSNLDETLITIVDKDPENGNKVTFEANVKLGELLRMVCTPEIILPTFNLDTRFGRSSEPRAIIAQELTEEEIRKLK